ATITKKYCVPKSLVREWGFLALECLERECLSARLSPIVSAGRIEIHNWGRTDSGKDVYLKVVLTSGENNEHWLELSEDRARTSTRSKLTFPTPVGRGSGETCADIEFRLSNPDTDPASVLAFFRKVEDIFDTTAQAVIAGIQCDCVIAILFTGSPDWPPGRCEVGPYVLARAEDTESLDGRYVFLARKVCATSSKGCEAFWHARLNTAVSLLSVLTSRHLHLWKYPSIPDEISCKLQLYFHPFVERADKSKLLRWVSNLSLAEMRCPHRKTSSRGEFIRDDLAQLFDWYETLEDKRRAIIDDCLTAFQVGIENRELMPTVALSAYWTALERLVDWDTGIHKQEEPCDKCNHPKSRSLKAVPELIESVLSPTLTDTQRAQL
ncbi:MAG: hypothetical protein ACRD2L_08505, partial [Terriglobia bacterium]